MLIGVMKMIANSNKELRSDMGKDGTLKNQSLILRAQLAEFIRAVESRANFKAVI